MYTIGRVYPVLNTAPISFTPYKSSSWRCSHFLFSKAWLVNPLTEASPRSTSSKWKKKKSFSSCAVPIKVPLNKSTHKPLSTTYIIRRPSVSLASTLAIVCVSAAWVSPAGTLWLHPSKSNSSTGLLYFHLSYYIVSLWV